MTEAKIIGADAPEAFSDTLNALLPKLQPCGEMDFGPGEILIHAPGFEDRTLAVAGLIRPTGAGSAILLDYRPHDAKNRLAEVSAVLLARGFIVSSNDIIEYHRFEPGDFESRLQSRLGELGASRVTIDISTMSKLAIMLVLHTCYELQLQVRVFYSEAAAYAPTREQFESARAHNKIHQPTLQIFTGIYGVVRVDSLASVAMQGQPTAALVFMSFNDALTQALLNTVYPSRLFLINGRPPTHTWREEATAWIHDQVRREWEDDNPIKFRSEAGLALPSRVASTLDYRESTNLLLQLYWQLSTNYRILLAPAGSKCQALGCYLVKALHPDIHVEYPSPDGFFPNYSTGIGRGWILNLGNLADLVSRISAVERREYLEIPMNPSSESVSA